MLPIFIFDSNILDGLDDRSDRRVSFIHQALDKMRLLLEEKGSALDTHYGDPSAIFERLASTYKIQTVFTNHDYEPYARERDEAIKKQLSAHGINFSSFKDQVIFEKNEVMKDSNEPYAVFTPYSKKWKAMLLPEHLSGYNTKAHFKKFFQGKPIPIIPLEEMGFAKTSVDSSPRIDELVIADYHQTRNAPSMETSKLGVHLRFGTISIRSVVKKAGELNSVFLNELIWREFFMQLLWHQPRLVAESCKKEYDNIQWRNDEADFEKWCSGKTGYPIVDAGMHELNATGFMHNRVRMITASFLVKHLLIDWRWGESYFAKKLVDYELASNNGNWQWVAGGGCDAAPYFRIFNPTIQTKKFDPQLSYINKWLPDLDPFSYPPPMVNHEFARDRCLKVYKEALSRY